MNIFYLLIGVSLIAAIIFLILFIRAVKTGQFDDTYTPSVRILFDDDEIEAQKIEKKDDDPENKTSTVEKENKKHSQQNRNTKYQ